MIVRQFACDGCGRNISELYDQRQGKFRGPTIQLAGGPQRHFCNDATLVCAQQFLIEKSTRQPTVKDQT